MQSIHENMLKCPLSEFIIITVYYKKGGDGEPPIRSSHETTHIVHASQLDTMLLSIKSLHENPKINPGNGLKPSQLYEIYMSKYQAAGPYWWSAPDLGRNDDPKGAILISEAGKNLLWRHPEWQAVLDKEEEEMYRVEREG